MRIVYGKDILMSNSNGFVLTTSSIHLVDWTKSTNHRAACWRR